MHNVQITVQIVYYRCRGEMFQLKKIGNGDNGEFIKTCDKIVIIYKTEPRTYWVFCTDEFWLFCASLTTPVYYEITIPKNGRGCGEYVYDGDNIKLILQEQGTQSKMHEINYLQIFVDNNCC